MLKEGVVEIGQACFYVKEQEGGGLSVEPLNEQAHKMWEQESKLSIKLRMKLDKLKEE